MKSLKVPPMHSATKQGIDSWLTNPSHGVLLKGRFGHNQNDIAVWLAHRITSSDDNVVTVSGRDSIGIDGIREIVRYSKQKNEAGARLAIAICDGENMTVEAQNAFLKMLEEPASGTYFVIACAEQSRLLSTIVSRLQAIDVKPVSKEQFAEAYKDQGDDETAKRWRLSGGLLDRGQIDEEMLQTAKLFISSDKYSRFKLAKDFSKDRLIIKNLIGCLYPIIEHLLTAAINDGEPEKKVDALLRRQLILLRAEELLDQNANPKAVLSFMATGL